MITTIIFDFDAFLSSTNTSTLRHEKTLAQIGSSRQPTDPKGPKRDLNLYPYQGE